MMLKSRFLAGLYRRCPSPLSASARCVLLGMLSVFTLFTACERRPLEVILDEAVAVRIVVRWQVNFIELYGNTPNGMTVMIWNAQGGAPIIRTTNADNITVQLEPGNYYMAIFNELAEDYSPYLRFYDADSYDRMALRATTFTVGGGSTPTRGDGTTYMYTPEDPRIAVALDTFDITPAMVMQDTTIFIPYEKFRDNGYVDYRESEYTYEIDEVPWPMTVDLYVNVRLKNRQSLKTINGSISGMADGFYMSRIIRTTETGTLRFDPERWDRNKYGEDEDKMGVISTRLASFGLPFGKELLAERDSADNIIKFSFTLTNDSTLNYTFKVGKDIRYITPEGEEARIRYRTDLQNLRLVLTLPDIIDLPDVNPTGGTGFDAHVDEWEDGGTLDLGGF